MEISHSSNKSIKPIMFSAKHTWEKNMIKIDKPQTKAKPPFKHKINKDHWTINLTVKCHDKNGPTFAKEPWFTTQQTTQIFINSIIPNSATKP